MLGILFAPFILATVSWSPPTTTLCMVSICILFGARSGICTVVCVASVGTCWKWRFQSGIHSWSLYGSFMHSHCTCIYIVGFLFKWWLEVEWWSTQITSDCLLEESKSWRIAIYRNWWWLQAGNGSTYSGRVKLQLSPSNLTALIMSCLLWLWCFT